MLNLKVGAPQEADGRACIATERGRSGFALYGPYVPFKPGEYAAEFVLAATADRGSGRVAVLEVTREAGSEQLASRAVAAEEIGEGWSRFVLPFRVAQLEPLEFRVWVSGGAALLIQDEPRAAALISGDNPAAVLAEPGFPESAQARLPFLAEHAAILRDLHGRGVTVRARADGVVLGVAGIALHARRRDDLTFIGEVFFEGAYNVKPPRPVCVVDIGMNIGLASLLFASKPEVAEVHAFEPFPATFARALDNLALNPTLAAKIRAHNAGLSDREVDGPLSLMPTGDSGSFSTVEHVHGAPTPVVLHDAGAVLAPIVAAAEARGLGIVVKVDCEGSEFAVFESLARHGLLGRIDALMVEWHAMFHDKDQEALLAPLRAQGFLVFDRSPPQGNGFFYAVRLGR